MFKDNSIIICNKNYKKNILKKLNKLCNIKIYSIDDFIKLYYFTYDEDSILYVMQKYDIDYSLSIEYLDNLIYIEDKIYNNKILDDLVSLKKELISNNLLVFNEKFKDYINGKNIIIYNYDLNKFEKYLLRDLKYEIIDTNINTYIPKIYEFNTMLDEVNFVAYKISDLIYNGTDISNIKLTNIGNDYIDIINKVFSFYNLKTNKHHKTSISSTIIGKTFLDNLDCGIEYAVSSISKYSNTKTYNKIIDLCNKYMYKKDYYILLSNALKNTYLDSIKYSNEIEVVDYQSYDFKDEYVFLLGFNQGIIPKTYKDEDYIEDKYKPLYLDNTNEKNKHEKEAVIKKLKNIKNLIITYKLKDSNTTYYPSTILSELGSVEKVSINNKISYSSINDKLNLGIKIDNLIKFNEKSELLDLLLYNYDIPYNTYSHRYSKVDPNKIKEFIKNKKAFNLSYSSLDNYNRCSFRFYIEKILELNNFTERFSVTLGSIYHYVLENIGCDIREKVDEYITNNEIVLTNSNRFFLEKAIANLEYLVNILNKQNMKSSLNNIENEKFIKINIKDNINFVGFIDKVMSNENYMAIVDYKTYVKKPTLKYVDYGIDLQLPVYMYLINKIYSNIRFVGFYLQNITLDNKSDSEKEKSLKLIGFTNKDLDALKYLDKDYDIDTYIDNIKINNDGTPSSNSLKRMLSDDEMKEIVSKVELTINKNLESIMNSEFNINPKYDNGNIGCEFCSYKDICYMQNYDLEKLELRGEDNEFYE